MAVVSVIVPVEFTTLNCMPLERLPHQNVRTILYLIHQNERKTLYLIMRKTTGRYPRKKTATIGCNPSTGNTLAHQQHQK